MIRLTIDTTGLKDLQKAILNKSKALKSDLDLLVKVSGLEALRVAKKEAPVSSSELRSSLNLEQVKEMTYSLYSNAPHAPFVEFGTGRKANDIPSDFNEMASYFKSQNYSGTYDDAIKSIEDWLQRQGEDPKDAKRVLYFVLKNGLTPQPFLWPAYKKGRKVLVQDVKDYVNNFNLDE